MMRKKCACIFKWKSQQQINLIVWSFLEQCNIRGGNCSVVLPQKDEDGQKLALTDKCRGLWKLWKLDNAIMWRKGLCFIANAVSCASSLGYVLSRVCMLHDQSPSTGFIGSVMTKAISIETALLVSLPAEWPAAPLRCAFIFDTLNRLQLIW